MRGCLGVLLCCVLLVPVAAQAVPQHIVVRIDSGAAQRLQAGLLTPQFEVVEPVSGVRSALKIVAGGFWVAELDIPAPANSRVLQRLALVPLASAGPDAVTAIVRLQEQWAAADPWPLVRGVLGWAWGPRDPRFSAKNQTLTLMFPPNR